MQAITVWRKFYPKTETEVAHFEHNHIEDGHTINKKPTGKFKSQIKTWAGSIWDFKHAHLNEQHSIVY
jgi:hypothetical protein